MNTQILTICLFSLSITGKLLGMETPTPPLPNTEQTPAATIPAATLPPVVTETPTPPPPPAAAPSDVTTPVAPATITEAPATAAPPTPAPTVPTATTPAASTTTATTETQLTPEIEQEFKTLNATLEEIRTAKKELVDQLKTLDEKQQEGRTEITTAQKATKDILSSKQEAEAQAQLDKVNESLKKITAIDTLVAGELTKKFDDSIKKINNLISKATTSITTLQAKGIALQMIQAKIQTTNQETTKVTTEKSPTLPTKTQVKKDQEETWWDSVVKFCAKVGHRIKKVFNRIKNIASSPENDTQALKKKSRESVIDTKQGSQDTPSAPTAKLSSSIEDKVKSNSTELESITKKLQINQETVTTKLDVLNKQSNELMTTLKIEDATKSKTDTKIEPAWKRISILLFGEFLDFTAFVVKGIKDSFVWIYQKTLGPVINKFTSDVKEKIKKEEQKEATPSQAKVGVQPSTQPNPTATDIPSSQVNPAPIPETTPASPTP